MEHANWECPKCDHREFEIQTMRTEGGLLSSMFDIATNKFSTLTCTRCQYTELYRTDSKGIDRVLDFLAG